MEKTNKVPQTNTSTHSKHGKRQWLFYLLIFWILGKTVGCLTLIPHPWGPKVQASLPNGDIVYFQSRSIGRETDDRLTLITFTDDIRYDFWVDQIHAGFGRVIIKLKEDGTGIWIESDGKVGASLDLTIREFRPEYSSQFTWAKLGEGKIIADGQTGNPFNLFLPW